jgi:predicted ATP-binding protein involved in virulence
MIKIKRLTLENFCGYRNSTFDFTNNGVMNPVNLFFGPNGSGKSTILDALNILSMSHRLFTKENDMYFRKMIYHEDYDPSYVGFEKSNRPMKIEGIFETDDGNKRVLITDKGVEVNEVERFSWGIVYGIDADHPMSMQKFQLHKEMSDIFLDMAKLVYGFDCKLDQLCESFERGDKEHYYKDFIIDKHGTKVHFRRMSAGERKIATLLSSLCDPTYIQNIDIITIDNLELHIYFARHAAMIDKLLSTFPDKQFICTTHSGTLIEHVREKYGKMCLYDLEEHSAKCKG